MAGLRILALAGIVVAAAAAQDAPIVHGDEVTFLATGTPSDPPRIVGDFNGWRPSAMTPAGRGTYALRVHLDPSARIEYLLAYANRFATDPANPLTVPAPGGLRRSELRMPFYRPPESLPVPRTRGRIDEIPFESRDGETRQVRVYVPAAPARSQVVYVHDGDIAVAGLDMPAMLDALIDAGDLPPVVAVFVDAVDRHDDYEPGAPFRTVFAGEIVPDVEQRYGLANPVRGLVGFSRSTVGALDACVNSGVAFAACGLVAPAISPALLHAVVAGQGSRPRVSIAAGTYDIPLVTDARALRDALRSGGFDVSYTELPQGHNHTAFRAALPAIVRALFPTR